MAGMTIIVRTIARLLFPFMFLFGAYVVAHGHLTPGGGFPGGVIIAASFVMLILAYGIEQTQKRMSFMNAEVLDTIGGGNAGYLGAARPLCEWWILSPKCFPAGGTWTSLQLGQPASALLRCWNKGHGRHPAGLLCDAVRVSGGK